MDYFEPRLIDPSTHTFVDDGEPVPEDFQIDPVIYQIAEEAGTAYETTGHIPFDLNWWEVLELDIVQVEELKHALLIVTGWISKFATEQAIAQASGDWQGALQAMDAVSRLQFRFVLPAQIALSWLNEGFEEGDYERFGIRGIQVSDPTSMRAQLDQFRAAQANGDPCDHLLTEIVPHDQPMMEINTQAGAVCFDADGVEIPLPDDPADVTEEIQADVKARVRSIKLYMVFPSELLEHVPVETVEGQLVPQMFEGITAQIFDEGEPTEAGEITSFTVVEEASRPEWIAAPVQYREGDLFAFQSVKVLS